MCRRDEKVGNGRRAEYRFRRLASLADVAPLRAARLELLTALPELFDDPADIAVWVDNGWVTLFELRPGARRRQQRKTHSFRGVGHRTRVLLAPSRWPPSRTTPRPLDGSRPIRRTFAALEKA